jgi:hypothetical protein
LCKSIPKQDQNHRAAEKRSQAAPAKSGKAQKTALPAPCGHAGAKPHGTRLAQRKASRLQAFFPSLFSSHTTL